MINRLGCQCRFSEYLRGKIKISFALLQRYYLLAMRSQSLFIFLLCFGIFMEENQAIRLRLPGLKISATFRKTATYLKKKFHLDTSKEEVSEPLATSQENNTDQYDEL